MQVNLLKLHYGARCRLKLRIIDETVNFEVSNDGVIIQMLYFPP